MNESMNREESRRLVENTSTLLHDIAGLDFEDLTDEQMFSFANLCAANYHLARDELLRRHAVERPTHRMFHLFALRRGRAA